MISKRDGEVTATSLPLAPALFKPVEGDPPAGGSPKLWHCSKLGDRSRIIGEGGDKRAELSLSDGGNDDALSGWDGRLISWYP